MADDMPLDDAPVENMDAENADGENTAPRKRKRRWAKRIGWALAALLAPIVLLAGFLATPIGKRVVADQIAQVSPASGLRFQVGRIEGDVYNTATLHDVVLLDPKGEFLVIPEVQLDWRPLAWLWSGLDIREVTARRGKLMRMPELLPGDPDAPILPDFDIRVDRFEIENLTLAPGLAGDEAQRVNLIASIDIRDGRTQVNTRGRFGAEDQLAFMLDARPDGDVFDLDLDYRAASDGVIAQMAGLNQSYRARLHGDGSWSDWRGSALIQRGEINDRDRAAAFRITNRSGKYGIAGQIYPAFDQTGLIGRAAGETISLLAGGTIESSVFDGDIDVVSRALELRGEGAIDLAGNRFDGFDASLRLRDPGLLGTGITFRNTRATVSLNGLFREVEIDHQLQIGALEFGTTRIDALIQQGTAQSDVAGWRIPINASAARIATGNAIIDPKLIRARLNGILTVTGSELSGRDLRLAFPSLNGRFALNGDVIRGAYTIAGPVVARDVAIDNVGVANGSARVRVRIGAPNPWDVTADFAATLKDLSNPTIANLAGSAVEVDGSVSAGADQPIELTGLELLSERLTMQADSGIANGTTSLVGSGEHSQYGAFQFDAALSADGPRADMVLASPLPAAGLTDVKLAISPSETGFAIDTSGQSLLGQFEGALGLSLPESDPAQIEIERLRIWQTNVTGAIAFADGGADGRLSLAGGGLDGAIILSPGDDAQIFDAKIEAREARFGGETPIAIATADIDVAGSLGEVQRFEAGIRGSGFEYGELFIGQFAANGYVEDGTGEFTASLAGRRSDRFALKIEAELASDSIALFAGGQYAGQPITMPRRAVLTQGDNGGWQLAKTQLGFGRGFAVVEGAFGGSEARLDLALSRLPLALADLTVTDLGIGGAISGRINYRQQGDAMPTGEARVRIDDFTRSGLILSSRPLDVLAVIELTPDALGGGVAFREDGQQLGRLDGGITSLASQGALMERLRQGRLDADLTYDGPAQSLWGLSGVETFDLSGPAQLRANINGTLVDPSINGRVSGDGMRVRSALSGTDVENVSARGVFEGSRLRLSRFAGQARGGGRVTGSGTVDFAQMGATRGPQLDLRIAADNAQLLNANGLSATLTGPMRIVSSGRGGTIAGRLKVNEASWSLGIAAEDLRLPNIATREVNLPVDSAPTKARSAGQWSYLIDAQATSRIAVDGLGLDSEWGADIILRGTTDDPRIGGEARLVRGAYSFAGTRFELTRGGIEFDENLPIDPRLDIVAVTAQNGLDVTAKIAGNAQSPSVTFASTPALPEEEILARLLFGDSIATLSATDALQLGAAVASLRGGGGGLDPIGKLRNAIGLDQLRIVSADPALNRDTAIALGKNIGEQFYIEIITDGRGYSATKVEYRITRWLALLASVSTIGRESVVAEISRDY